MPVGCDVITAPAAFIAPLLYPAEIMSPLILAISQFPAVAKSQLSAEGPPTTKRASNNTPEFKLIAAVENQEANNLPPMALINKELPIWVEALLKPT